MSAHCVSSGPVYMYHLERYEDPASRDNRKICGTVV